MSANSQHRNIIIVALCFVAVVAIVALIGFFAIGNEQEIIQGEIEVTEYRVSCKLPGRVARICVEEGQMVHKGDTLAIVEVPEVDAQQKVAEATKGAAVALSNLAGNGARKETIQAAYQLYQQAQTAKEIAEKTYKRIQNLYDQGVISAQKRDEAQAAFRATEAAELVAKSQYEMAKNGARSEEKDAAAKQAEAAIGAVDVFASLLKETVQIAAVDGKVSEIYPLEGELLGLGSPIMTIALVDDFWGTFNVREDKLKGMKVGDTFKAYSPALDKDVDLKVFNIKDQGSYAVWKATKSNGQYDLKTFEVKARPVNKVEGLCPGMSLIVKGGSIN